MYATQKKTLLQAKNNTESLDYAKEINLPPKKVEKIQNTLIFHVNQKQI